MAHLQDYKNCPKCGRPLRLDPYSAEWQCIALGHGCNYTRSHMSVQNGGKLKSC